MSKTPKPIIHSRDHEHGGADPVRIVWESTGGTGSGGTSAGLATIKAFFFDSSVPDSSDIGSVTAGMEYDWTTYDYVLEQPPLLYLDPTTNLPTNDLSGDEYVDTQGALYLNIYNCVFTGHLGTWAEIQGTGSGVSGRQVEWTDTKWVPTDDVVRLQLSYVSLNPGDRVKIKHDAPGGGSQPSVNCAMSVTLINPGPVPYP